MEFGTDEFYDVFDSAAGGKENVPSRIGKPTLFVFAPTGEVVFAGCNGTSGIKVDDDFKKFLVQGIATTGRIARPSVELTNADEVNKQLRTLLTSKKPLEAAIVLSNVYRTHTPKTGSASEIELNKLSALTGIELTPPSLGSKIDKHAMKLLDRARKMVAAELKSVKRSKKTADQAALVIEKINEAFSGFSGLQTFFEETWKKLEQDSGTNGLQAKAKMMMAESPLPAPATSEIEYDESETGETQAKEEPRTWRSSNGKFSVVGILLGVDQGKVRLRTKAKEIEVPLNSLSEEDREYVKSRSD
jgi:hypothetical protein